MATRRRSRRKTISGNLTDIQKRVRYLETRPSASRLASKVVSTRNIALRAVEEDIVADNAIVRRAIDQGAVGTNEIEQESITTPLIDNLAVTTGKIDNEAVTTDKIDNLAVTTDKIDNEAVTNVKLEGGITDSKLVGIQASKLDGDVQDSQISSISASKINGVLDTDNIPNLDTSKITSGVLDIDTIPEITADRMPNLDASKFTTGIFEETNIPNLPASKITTGQFFEGRIPNLSTSKLTTGVLAVARMPVFPNSEIATDAVTTEKIRNDSVLSNKIPITSFVSLLSSTFRATNPMIVSASSSIFNIQINRGSSSNQVASGNHVHGTLGYTNAGSTGVASHTHPISIPSFIAGVTGDSSPHTRLSGGEEGAAAHGSGTHFHSRPAFSGTATSNTSTLKLKKEISIYEVPNIKNLLNLQLKRYKYKNQVRHLQESINRDWMYGYIAEEVEELGFKELVGYDEKGEPASLNYGLLSTLVLELVKVQQTEISLIKEKIKRRREKYDKLSS
jgi:hypothetical protein